MGFLDEYRKAEIDIDGFYYIGAPKGLRKKDFLWILNKNRDLQGRGFPTRYGPPSVDFLRECFEEGKSDMWIDLDTKRFVPFTYSSHPSLREEGVDLQLSKAWEDFETFLQDQRAEDS